MNVFTAGKQYLCKCLIFFFLRHRTKTGQSLRRVRRTCVHASGVRARRKNDFQLFVPISRVCGRAKTGDRTAGSPRRWLVRTLKMSFFFFRAILHPTPGDHGRSVRGGVLRESGSDGSDSRVFRTRFDTSRFRDARLALIARGGRGRDAFNFFYFIFKTRRQTRELDRSRTVVPGFSISN